MGQEYDDANWTEFPPTVSTDAWNFILNHNMFLKILYKIFYICLICYTYIRIIGSDLNVSFELLNAFMSI